jgi:acyl-CoA thioester hydrolase
MTQIHTVEYRVYYEDTDALGVMYHSNFINFCERGRSELLRDIGLSASNLSESLKIGFVVRHISCDYLKMVKLDDLLCVQTSVQSMKNTSFVMKQDILKKEDGQNFVAFSMDITLVCMDADGKPTRLPEALRNKFNDYLKDPRKDTK